MSLLKPNVNELGEKLIKCPECGEVHTLKIFYTNVSVALKGISVLPFNRKYTALCLGCKGLFTLDSDIGDNYLMNRDTPIASENLIKKEKENA